MSFTYLEKPKTVLATKSLVEEFYGMDPAPHDRPLSEKRIQIYERILSAGLFRPVVWASGLCYETNCIYRVNGKHTATMLHRIPGKLPDFWVTIERWKCEKLRDVSQLYGTYDSNISSRTTADINMSFAAAIPELKDVPKRIINLTVIAASCVKWEEAVRFKVPPAERAEELVERAAFARWMWEVLGTTTNSRITSNSVHLLRGPVAWAMLATYDRAPMVAKQFWTQVRDESAPNNDDPTRKLAKWLIRTVLGSRGAKGKEMASNKEVYVKCIRAWNAHRSGEATTLQFRHEDPLPAVSK